MMKGFGVGDRGYTSGTGPQRTATHKGTNSLRAPSGTHIPPGRRTQMFERFTDRARRVVVLAQEEARLLNHNYIGTEHLLLGLIHEGEGLAAKALESLGVTLDQVRSQVEDMIGVGTATPQ